MIFLSQIFLFSFVANTTYINNNNFPTDLNGNLEGNVLYAQSQIIPQNIRIQDDIQPRLVSQRHTLVLFKLISPNPYSNKVEMSVINSKGVLKLLTDMNPPENIMGNILGLKPGSKLNFDSIDSLLPNAYNIPANKLGSLDDSEATYLKSVLNNNNVVAIYTYNGQWAKDFYLPQGNYNGKTVIAVSQAAYNSNLISRNKSTSVSNGSKVQVKMIDGEWWFEFEKYHDKYRYGQFWTSIIPYVLVEPGMEISFKLNNLKGFVKPEIGGPSQLLLNTIDLGLLTEPQNKMTLGTDIILQREYFITIPAAEMIVAQYETIQFNEVKMPWGDLYTLPKGDPSEGGIYSGNMRQNTAKVLISHGIDNANYGLNSSVGSNESGHPYLSAQLTAHNSIGLYSNGKVVHGLSGGNGMVTLSGSSGNEVSHEIGHNYGLGHYTGGGKYCIHRPPNEVGSTWGWDNYNNLFIPNFSSWEAGKICASGSCVDPFTIDGKTFTYGKDAMAGGFPMWNQCRFTMYTPYSMKLIQQFFESKAIFDKTSPTGFSIWSETSKKLIPYEHKETVYTKNDVDLTKENDFEDVFKNNEITVQTMKCSTPKDKKYTIPKPSNCNIGKILEFNHYSSPVSIDTGSEKIELVKGASLQLFSDGNVWKVLKNKKTDIIVHKPCHFGIPVAVLVGYYDAKAPYKRGGFIFPALYGSHGYVYPSEYEYIPICRLVVKTKRKKLIYPLKSTPYDDKLNKFHVAISRLENITNADIYCGNYHLASTEILPPKDLTEYNKHGKNCNDIPNKSVCKLLEKGEVVISK